MAVYAVYTVLFFIVLALAFVCLGLVLRCCGLTRISLGRRELILDRPPAGLSGERFTWPMAVKSLLWGAGVLAAVYGASLIFCAVERDAVTGENFLAMWKQWDANNYIRIAELGYAGYDESGMHTLLVFFPLYSWLIRGLHLLVSDYRLCGHIIACLCYVGACYMFARLVTEDFGWSTAQLALGLLSAYPFAFFFAAPFQESLFLLLTVTALWLIRRHRWLWAALVGALAAMTRMQGVLLIFAGAVEYCLCEDPIRRIRDRDWSGLWRGLWRDLLPLALILTGTGMYLLINWRVDDDPFQFMTYQKEIWSNGFAMLPICLKTMWDNLVYRWGQELMFVLWGPQLAVFAVSLAALLYSLRRLPPVWTAYLLGCTLLNFSLSWPLSCGRYTACSFPLFAAAAVACRRHPAAGRSIVLASALFQAALLSVYLAGKQVM